MASWRRAHCRRYRGMTGGPVVESAPPRLSQATSFSLWKHEGKAFPYTSSQHPSASLLLGTTFTKVLQNHLPFSFFSLQPKVQRPPCFMFPSDIKWGPSTQGVDIHIGCILNNSLSQTRTSPVANSYTAFLYTPLTSRYWDDGEGSGTRA